MGHRPTTVLLAVQRGSGVGHYQPAWWSLERALLYLGPLLSISTNSTYSLGVASV